MILESLVRYYEILAADESSGISKPGYTQAKVSFALVLSPQGEFLELLPLKVSVSRGKDKTAEIPQSMEVPEQAKKTVGIIPNFLCENCSYVFGLSEKDPERAKKCFAAFRDLHHQLLNGVICPEASALLSFLDSWDPEEAADHPAIKAFWKDLLAGGKMVFRLDGGAYLHQVPAIRNAWELYRENDDSARQMQCLVTGRMGPVARLHPSIKGVRGAQSMGVSLVSFNASAYESYGQKQGDNAPVSKYAAFAYTTALNHLLANPGNCLYLGDSTVVFWAESSNPIYQNLFAYAMNPEENAGGKDEKVRDEGTELLTWDIFQKAMAGQNVGKLQDLFQPETSFYILGLSPNVARLSVRFFIRDSFGGILEKLRLHFEHLSLAHAPNEFRYISLWRLMNETVSPKSKDKNPSSLLTGAVLRSIYTAAPYPEELFQAVYLRIRAERDITYQKAAILKACLIRKYQYQNTNPYKEELTVALNENSTNKAYLLGRLFAMLEKAQYDVNPNINTTIKDRYFNSFSTNPQLVFPTLMNLYQHHIAKSNSKFTDKIVEDILDKMGMDREPIPARLSLEEQGIFILGYYQQRRANFTKKEG